MKKAILILVILTACLYHITHVKQPSHNQTQVNTELEIEKAKYESLLKKVN